MAVGIVGRKVSSILTHAFVTVWQQSSRRHLEAVLLHRPALTATGQSDGYCVIVIAKILAMLVHIWIERWHSSDPEWLQ